MTPKKFRNASFEVGDLVETNYFCFTPKTKDVGIITSLDLNGRIPTINVWWQLRGKTLAEHSVDLIMLCRNCDTNN